MGNVFCVILSKYRIYQGLALYHSLERRYPGFHMSVLCMDDETYTVLNRLKLNQMDLVKTESLEDDKLKKVQKERRLNEYCWTMKPYFMEYALNHYGKAEYVIYLDADIFFFNSPDPLFRQHQKNNILLSEHDFLEKESSVEKFCGKYNSGFMVFKQVPVSAALLKWWKGKCLDWCFDTVSENRFGDQKYLEDMPVLFDGVVSIATPGVNIAPWNDDRYEFSLLGGRVHVNNDPLICYHFCGLRILNRKEYALLIGDRKPNKYIHPAYVKAIKKAMYEVDKVMPGFNGFFVEDHFLDRARVFKFKP